MSSRELFPCVCDGGKWKIVFPSSALRDGKFLFIFPSTFLLKEFFARAWEPFRTHINIMSYFCAIRSKKKSIFTCIHRIELTK